MSKESLAKPSKKSPAKEKSHPSKKSPAKPKEDQTYASDESGVYERYGLSTHSRVYADYIEQNKPKLRKISVCDMSFIRKTKTILSVLISRRVCYFGL